jgi:hypothetical protein
MVFPHAIIFLSNFERNELSILDEYFIQTSHFGWIFTEAAETPENQDVNIRHLKLFFLVPASVLNLCISFSIISTIYQFFKFNWFVNINEKNISPKSINLSIPHSANYLHESGLLGSEEQWLWEFTCYRSEMLKHSSEKLNFKPKKKRNECQSHRKSKVFRLPFLFSQ